MKGLLKRAAVALLTAACLMSLSACSAEDSAENAPKISTEGVEADAYTGQMVVQQAVSLLISNEEGLLIQRDFYQAQGNKGLAEALEVLREAKSEYGTIHGLDVENARVVQLADGTYTVSMGATFDEGEMNYVMNINAMTGDMQVEFIPAGGDDAGQTTSQKMEAGGLYAALGIGTVFGVLVFISLLICCFKFIHQWEENKKNAKQEPAPAPAPVAAPTPAAAAPVAPAVTEDLMEDAELVAVISAAIAAYQGTSSNGLVVRSIRRLPGSKWKQN